MASHVALDGALTRLVPTTENDLDLLASWFADSDFVEHWGGVPLSRQEVAEKYVGRRRPQVESFLVLAQGTAVGYAQYWHSDATEGGIDLVLTSGARGRGLGPDAAHALVTHLCSERGWRRVTVDPASTNLRAVHAWEKAGFQRLAQEGPTSSWSGARQDDPAYATTQSGPEPVPVHKANESYPHVQVEDGGPCSGQAGVVLVKTVRKTGLNTATSATHLVTQAAGGARSGQVTSVITKRTGMSDQLTNPSTVTYLALRAVSIQVEDGGEVSRSVNSD